MSYTRRIVAIYTFTILGTFTCCPKLALSAVSFTGDVQTGSQLYIGNTGFGTFRIDSGSAYTSTSSASVIGNQSGAVGIATVTGAGSQWSLTNSNGVDIGYSGYGRLEILNGGVVTTTTSCCGGSVDIGNNSGSEGAVVVDGSGSMLNAGALNVGPTFSSSATALLQISNNAMVFSGQTTVSASGRVELNNAYLRVGQNTSNNGVIVGSGEVQTTSTSTFTNSGRLESSGGALRFTGQSGTIQNTGVIAAESSALEFNRTITNLTSGSNAAEITLRNGIVRAGLLTSSGAQLTNSAVLAALGGTSDFYGRVTNTATGSIAVTNHSVLIFHDDVTADGGTITVFPGSSAIFLEDLTMNPGSKLLANLAGTNQDTGFGDAEVVGVAQLAGSVGASLAAGFTPQAGDTFPLIAASSLSGSLGLGDMPALPAGLKWDLDMEANRVLLSVVPGLAGDYNGDGAVNSADYVVWRKTLDQTGANLPADGNSNGRVDAADFDFWRARLGNTSGTGLATAATVPEPASIMLLFVGLALVAGRGRKLQ
jgi:T5SS/PEP-CTERM-associated repeat protein